jgi:hypothetical protein
MLFFNYITGYEGDAPTDQMGLPYTKQEISGVISSLVAYVRECPNSVIEESRQAFFERYFPEDYNLKKPPIRSERKKKNGHIYLLSRQDGAHKIGYSKSLDDRIKALQYTDPSIKLEYFFKSDDTVEAEWELHQEHIDKTLGGKWFNLSRTDIFNIKSITDYSNGQFVRRSR